jgi:hypothetical protein
MDEVGRRRWTYAPPPWRMFEALTVEVGQWLADAPAVLEAERPVLEAERPGRVVWASLWSHRPHDTVELLIAPHGAGGSGSEIVAVWRSPLARVEADKADKADRHRLGVVVGGLLRDFVG